MRWVRITLGTTALLVVASGCRHSGQTNSGTAAPPTQATLTAPRPTSPSEPPTTTTSPETTADGPLPVPPSPPTSAGSCHAHRSGVYVLPDPACTPGATNPTVTQANIDQTICTSGWTATIRPAESYTETLKYQQMAAYDDTGPVSGYEEDHLIPLELGGSPTSPRNLWPEPGASPNPKDSVESAANRAVCDGQMTLAAAQQAIAADWTALGRQLGVVQAQTPTTGTSTAQTATCTATSSYSSRYGDWDIYVHSDQPGQTVTVVASGGATASWHTDSTGYADVYLHAPENADGQRVTVTAGSATCSTTL